MKVLLTGGNGFIASYLAESFSSMGYEVMNVSRSTSPAFDEILLSKEEFEIYIHTAGLSSDTPFGDEKLYYDANVATTDSLLKRFKTDPKAKKFIYFSTLYVQNENLNQAPYPFSKKLAEKLLNEESDHRIHIIRPALVCDFNNARGVLAPIQKLAGKGLGLKFPKGYHMQWVSIDSIKDCILNILSGDIKENTFNLIDNDANLNDLKGWLADFGDKCPKITIYLPSWFLSLAFSFGHLMRLPFNKYFLQKLKS